MSERTSLTAFRFAKPVAAVVVIVVMAAIPLYFDQSWTIIGIFSMAAAVAAIGLTVLSGSAGQLSLAHAAFMAVGAYAYAFLSGPTGGKGYTGVGLSPLLAAVLAVIVAGLAGLAFSPVAARLRGFYLGVCTIGLVFLAQWVMQDATKFTGGVNGRSVEPLTVGGFELSGSNPRHSLTVLGVPFGGTERLWYVSLLLLVLTIVAAARILRSRPGRALKLVRDNEAAAAAMGISVQHAKATAFILSSAFAGLGGVLFALASNFIGSGNFDLVVSMSYLAMVVIGGLGSVGGAVFGAAFVTSLPLLLNKFSDQLPFLASPGSNGYTPGVVAQIVYGVVVVAVIIGRPDGVASFFRARSRVAV
ncbi:branched-chain amino acid ABC transporter permease [Nocardioides sp. Kera G14]|uniref:branched-chain amino acid ABC transporter permease n=1 Tax=Nocardioides sp. Kera G14 TaxID=2884264 RepID=UPI001D12971F|nr:branched-chain amino acid ABC transporter permease [Nocardioides sp. Kera G14]UDY23676.1 branched-chain amino acid ABC transporter permease [Nocardioides sp. Kera G14]